MGRGFVRCVSPALLFALAVTGAAVADVPPASDTRSYRGQATLARTLPLGGYDPFAGWTSYGALSHRWTVVTFSVVWDHRNRPPIPRWLARRASGTITGLQEVEWADSQSCRALMPVLREMSQLRPPRIMIPGTADLGELAMPGLDGVTHTLWGSGATDQPVAWGEVEMSSNVGPLPLWGERADQALRDCWGKSEPKLN